jgi:hypothetical protein
VGFWKTYRGFSPFVQVCLALSLVLGVCLLVLCLWGDSTHPPWFWPRWWHKLGYGLNIFASFTAFLIGVPIALVVLETIKSNAAQKQQIESVNRISKVAWSDFSKEVLDLCTDERINAVESTQNDSSPTDQVQAEHNIIMEEMEACRNAVREHRQREGANSASALAQIAALKRFLATHATTLSQRRRAVDEQFGTKSNLRPKWNYIVSLWQVLDTPVRLRRMEFGLEPIPKEWYKGILDNMSSSENVIFDFLQIHSGTRSRRRGIASISDLEALMDAILNLPPRLLLFVLENNYDEYIGSGVTTYWLKASLARTFLKVLKFEVDQVTRSGWPE